MNRTKIDWCDYTWNPVSGCKGPLGDGKHCPYCYAARIAKRFGGQRGFRPTFHHHRLYEPSQIKKPSRIFVSSMGDLFGDWVPREWIANVIDIAWLTEWHAFQFLTKNPKRLKDFNPWPANCWVGATATDQASYEAAMEELKTADAAVVFLSLEPLLGPIKLEAIPDWVIVGAMTGPGSKMHQPKKSWVDNIIRRGYAKHVPVFLKDNLNMKGPKQWPKDLQNGIECTAE